MKKSGKSMTSWTLRGMANESYSALNGKDTTRINSGIRLPNSTTPWKSSMIFVEGIPPSLGQALNDTTAVDDAADDAIDNDAVDDVGVAADDAVDEVEVEGSSRSGDRDAKRGVVSRTWIPPLSYQVALL